jgi:hypothetical protein
LPRAERDDAQAHGHRNADRWSEARDHEADITVGPAARAATDASR